MLPDRMHGSVCFRVFDLKPVAPLFLDRVSMGRGAESSPRSPMRVPQLRFTRLLSVPTCVTTDSGRCCGLLWSWRREGFVTDGFLDFWGLSSSKLWKRWARPRTGTDVGLIAGTESEVLGWCLWGSCGCSAWGLHRQPGLPEVTEV